MVECAGLQHLPGRGHRQGRIFQAGQVKSCRHLPGKSFHKTEGTLNCVNCLREKQEES